MSFKEIDSEIKYVYDSLSSDIVNDFYNKVLSESVRYDTISRSFSSTSLAIASKGIANFIRNNGHMRLLCGAELTQADQQSIENANDLEDYIGKNFIEEYENLEEEVVKDHVKLLGWMIANNFLEIKIGIPLKDGKIYPYGMLHSRIGLLYDENEDCIMFQGANSEILRDWSTSIEQFSVFKSWKENEWIIDAKEDFEELWNGQNENLMVLDVPDAIKNNLINIAPGSKEELENLLKL